MTHAIPRQRAGAHAGEEGVEGQFIYVSPRRIRRRLVGVPVDGDCMAPLVLPGDTVIVDIDASPRDGQLVLVLFDDDAPPMVRRYDKAEALLLADNGTEPLAFTFNMQILPITATQRDMD